MQPVMVLAFRDNHDAATTIPERGLLEMVGPADDDRFVIVRVGFEELLVFESDLQQNCVLHIPNAKSA